MPRQPARKPRQGAPAVTRAVLAVQRAFQRKSIEALYQEHHYPETDALHRQVLGFTKAAIRSIYQGQVRLHLQDLGYGDMRIAVNDPVATDAWVAFADTRSRLMTSTVNRMLLNRLNGQPGHWDDTQRRADLGEFWQGVHDYNQTTLLPYVENWSRGLATHQFYAQNGIRVDWSYEPTDTDSALPDRCREALDAAADATDPATGDSIKKLSADQADSYTPPEHQNCPHKKRPLPPPAGTRLPSAGQIWTGQIGPGEADDKAFDLPTIRWARHCAATAIYLMATELDSAVLQDVAPPPSTG